MRAIWNVLSFSTPSFLFLFPTNNPRPKWGQPIVQVLGRGYFAAKVFRRGKTEHKWSLKIFFGLLAFDRNPYPAKPEQGHYWSGCHSRLWGWRWPPGCWRRTRRTPGRAPAPRAGRPSWSCGGRSRWGPSRCSWTCRWSGRCTGSRRRCRPCLRRIRCELFFFFSGHEFFFIPTLTWKRS